MVRDISSAKTAERALADSEQRFRGLFEKAPLAYQSLDMAGNILEVNDAWLDLMGGLRHDEVTGRSITDFLTEKSLPTLAVNFPKFQRQGHIEGPVFGIAASGRGNPYGEHRRPHRPRRGRKFGPHPLHPDRHFRTQARRG
ncbi:MAG: PAS domain S-box protein [Sulfuritalea sp.]|nr:PAS domain S-box protein [Sulfuritalea sp.]